MKTQEKIYQKKLEEVENLHKYFFNKLKELKVAQAHIVVGGSIGQNCVEFGVSNNSENYYSIKFASEIRLYWTKRYNENEKYMEISVPGSGSFTPNDEASYWRVRHAANVLKNWNAVSDLVKEVVEKYCEIVKDY